MNHAFKAGTYYIGDPCYVVRKGRWMPFLSTTDFFRDPIREVGGFLLAGGGTAYGDGTYKDEEGRKYPVDAGMLSLIPMEWIKKYGKKPNDGAGHIVEFDKEFTVDVNGGIFRFGHVNIDTKNDEEEEEDPWEDEEKEEDEEGDGDE